MQPLDFDTENWTCYVASWISLVIRDLAKGLSVSLLDIKLDQTMFLCKQF